ncbi:aldehyde ferredoxin oxidoreductase family protein [Paucidesulfovibrio longus]|uniref:aldehyde ferredoxin oxidoreductase family protein n=1 Tax=Paucidesulfovibrio longus TaxID=889 RepID=UPI0003B36BB9|nr:aldehyde ferredoxin oxidoreductase family protein [Paucidesulfovibrio longus]
MYGFYGRVLKVDLTERCFDVVPLAEEILADHLGGKGLGTRLLLDENPPGADPLGPENRLIFATGPACNGPAWGGSRYGVYTKSPLTGLYCESYAGGKVPESMDSAGYDAIVISGRADRPMVLGVHPYGVDFHLARDLWGMETYEAEDEARERFAPVGFSRPGAVVIGPAGENRVRFALIENDYWRSAGRGGTGAVMGSKNLKAVVFAGDRKRPLADPKGMAAQAKGFAASGRDNPGVKAYKRFGTTMMVALMNTAGAFPARYWSQGTCEHWEKIAGEAYHAEHDVTPNACRKCFMACGRLTTIKGGRRDGLRIEGPEYETIYAFGGLCMIEDMAEIAYLNDLCDRLGLDTITGGNLCGLAIEAGLRGRIEPVVRYNDPDGCAALLRSIAAREGHGAVLAEGIRHAAQEWGLEDIAVHVKGMEPPGYDPRALKGMGLTYATTARGACHLRTTFYKPELSGMIPPERIEGKAEMLIDFEDRLALFDCLVLCRFYRDMYSWEELGKLVELLTGLPGDKARLQRIARRVVDLTRAFNLREGMSPDADRLPGRLTREALPDGKRVTEQEMARMTEEYYRLRGWPAQEPGA